MWCPFAVQIFISNDQSRTHTLRACQGRRETIIEADHGKLKLLIRPVRGFKTMKTAYATIKGFEVMRALRKGQAEMFALQGGIVDEARTVERAFGVGPCVLSEAMAWLQDRLAGAET